MDVPQWEVRRIVEIALAEDLGWGDITTQALIHADWTARGHIIAKEDGILCGVDVVEQVYKLLDPELRVEKYEQDGSRVFNGRTVVYVQGPAAIILQGERVALNFLQRMSGIATETRRYVDAVQGTKCRIVETRKTTPGLRILEKYAVRVGGGNNHRHSLSDAILIKDNHLAALRAHSMSLAEIISLAQQKSAHTVTIEVEVETPEEAEQAAAAGADTVMLDNMSLEETRRAMGLVNGRCLVEASGGVRLDTVQDIATTGVDLISVGALTHSVKSLDFSMEFSI
jgi:nicotinate-nucleotide pyrophosphorylase (carboxylating)